MFEYQPDGTDQVQRLTALIQIPGVKILADPVIGVVSIVGDTEEKVNMVEQYFKKHFKPKAPSVADRNIELTLHILYAKTASNVQAALQPVLQQLKQSTMLTSFRSVETQILRVRSTKRVEASGVLTWDDVPENVSPLYQFRTDVTAIGNSIRIDSMNFGVRIPSKVAENNFQFREVGITSTLDLKPGQFVVVGKTNTSPKDGALVLVLSAKLVD